MTQPWSNQGVSLIVIEAGTGNFTGLFIYSPAPGLGNLIYSDAPAEGKDPFGNAYLQGPVSYGFDSAANIWLADQTTGNGLAVWTATSEKGPWGQQYWLSMQAGSGGTAGQWVIGGATGVNPIVANDPASNAIQAETWHTMSLAAGWAARGAGFGVPKYRLLPTGDLQLSGQVTGTTGTGGAAQFATLPTPYFDTVARGTSCSLTSNLPGSGSARINLDTSGNLSFPGFSSSGVSITGQLDGVIIPLHT